MDYSHKLKDMRAKQASDTQRGFNQQIESDRGRTINAAAIRRLQQKTQVFPLETNAAVRSRLTHSLEVMQVGRYISKTILDKLANQPDGLKKYGLTGLEDGFVSLVEMACLLHDVGNPPFGHLGEQAINAWMRQYLSDSGAVAKRFRHLPNWTAYANDLCHYEGNAQALRLVHSLQQLNLTYSQLASLRKYTRMASVLDKAEGYAYRQKKPGYYLSEQTIYDAISKALNIGWGCRFPLAYIMEAADDISYCIADLDDALDKGILTVSRLVNLLHQKWQSLCTQDEHTSTYLPKILTKATQAYQDEPIIKEYEFMRVLRTYLVNDLVERAAQKYVDNHQAVFDGSLDNSLIEDQNECSRAAQTLKQVAFEHVFCAPEVEHLELKGWYAITGLLDSYRVLLDLPPSLIKNLALDRSIKSHPLEALLWHKLPNKHKKTYLASVQERFDEPSYDAQTWDNPTDTHLQEFYYRTRLIIDYVSGMTDHFALTESQCLGVS